MPTTLGRRDLAAGEADAAALAPWTGSGTADEPGPTRGGLGASPGDGPARATGPSPGPGSSTAASSSSFGGASSATSSAPTTAAGWPTSQSRKRERET